MPYSVGIFGTFLSWRGYYNAPCEELANLFENCGWKVKRSSSSVVRIFRLLDTIKTVFLNRNEIKVGIIDTYSGLGFFLAEITGYCLKLFHIPYIAVLHGGNLPQFSEKHPYRIRNYFQNAAKVVSPSRYLIEKMACHGIEVHLIPNPLEINNYIYRQRILPRPYLVWMRAFHEIYNPSLAVRVLHKLVLKGIDAKLAMIGPDKKDGSFRFTKKLAEELKVSDRIEFVGPAYFDPVQAEVHPVQLFPVTLPGQHGQGKHHVFFHRL